MLNENGVEFEYREYTEQPLSRGEIESVLRKMGVSAKDLLRKNDPAYRDLGLTGEEAEGVLVGLMAEHPTLVQRPIGIQGTKAVLGRPPEKLLEL